jgi:hypothetical protein
MTGYIEMVDVDDDDASHRICSIGHTLVFIIIFGGYILFLSFIDRTRTNCTYKHIQMLIESSN